MTKISSLNLKSLHQSIALWFKWTSLSFVCITNLMNLIYLFFELIFWTKFKWPIFLCTTNLMNLINFSWSKFEIWWTNIDFSELKLMNSLWILWTIKWIQFHKILNPRELNFVIYVGELIMNSSELFFVIYVGKVKL